MVEKNVHISKSDLRLIIFERALPENLKKGQVSITYGVLQDIFSIIEDSDGSERPLSPSNICDCLNLLCGRDVSSFVKKPSHFLKVKSNFIKNNPLCVNQLVPELTAQPTDCESSSSDINVSLGIYCDKLGVFRSVFDNILKEENNVSIAKVLLSNGALLELDNERSKQNLSWPEFSFVVSNLVDDDTAHITADFLRHHISSLKKQRNKLNIKLKNWPFYLCNFTIITELVVFLVVLVVLVLLCQLTLELIMLTTTFLS